MMEKYYRFAGLEFALSLPESLPLGREHRLEPFGVDAVTDPHVFTFQSVEQLTQPAGTCVCKQPSFWVYETPEGTTRYLGTMGEHWEDANIRAEHCGRQHVVQLKGSSFREQLSGKIILETLAVEHLLVRNNALVFHCACIDYKGSAVLFTAPSETGKSTQAELWNRYRNAEIINGDRAAVRVVDGTILAEGIPFAGSSSYCKNRSLPLKAIVYLAQAPEITIRKLRGYEAFARIWEGVTVNTWDRKDMDLVSDTVKRIAERIPVYYMPCTPDEDAVIALERELEKLVNV